MTGPPAEPLRPLPVPDELSAPYWDAAARHRLAVARCSRCGTFAHPPDVVCQACGTSDPEFRFTEVSGRGRVRSWTVMHQSFLPGFRADLPYVLVDVELVEQADLRLIGRLLDGPDAPLGLGSEVHVAFEDVTPEVSVPAFVLTAGADS
ncbi:MAG: OB-fold domain-containing protein [Actinomycetota bacterium]|nr:OB-fold domain-containing protein [Actinomycetota bacterium]